MYPFVTISGISIELTGVGIIVAFFIFVIVAQLRSKMMLMSFSNLYYALPGMISLIYGGGSYANFILSTGYVLPHSFHDLHSLLIPPSYQFHLGGMLIGMLLFLIFFINQQAGRLVRHKWIDCIFVAMMSAITILGLFLVIGDDMIGKSTESRIGIYALTPMSEVAKFNQVYPVGLFLSIAALLSSAIGFVFKKNSAGPGWGYGGFGVFLILLSIVLLYQHYPRHGVIMIGETRYDINQYICRILGISCILRFTWISGMSYKNMSKRIVHLVRQ